MNAASLVVSLWLATQADGDPFARPPVPPGRTAPAIRLGNPQPATAPRNPLRESPAGEQAKPARAEQDSVPAYRSGESRPAANRAAEIQPVEQTAAEVVAGGEAGAEGGAPRLTAKDLMAGLLVAPSGEGLTGEPLRLLDALGRSAGRPPADIIRAYWELASVTALYHQRRREAAQLDTFANAQREPAVEVKLAQGAARAALAESKVMAIAAQQRLRSLVAMPGGTLPVVADVPHTGAYHTYFQELFGSRPAPAEVTLLEQTLPLEKEALQARFKSALAAEDQCEQAWSQYQADKYPLADTLAAIAEAGRQERAFVQAVIRYNLDIAGYALRVAPAGVSSRTIVGMLIKDPLQRSATFDATGAVVPVSASELIEVSEPARLIPPDQGEPSGETDGQGRPVVRSTFEPRGAGAKTGARPATAPSTMPAADPRTRSEQIPRAENSPVMSRKPELPLQRPARRAGAAANAGLYSGLAALPLSEQAAGLGAAVFTDGPPPFASRAVTWNESQRQPSQGPARFWQTRAALARWMAWDQAAAQLAGLQTVVPAETLAAEQLACRAAQLAAVAEAADARIELHAAQFAWGSTLVHAGSNATALRQAAQLPLPTGEPDLAWLVDSGEGGAASPNLALWRTAIKQRAAAVLAADDARVRDMRGAAAGTTTVSAALASTRQQTEATLAFASTLANGQLAVGAGSRAPASLQPAADKTAVNPAFSKSPTGR